MESITIAPLAIGGQWLALRHDKRSPSIDYEGRSFREWIYRLKLRKNDTPLKGFLLMSLERAPQASQDPAPSSVSYSRTNLFSSSPMPHEYKPTCFFLGSGAYGTVRSGVDVRTGSPVAIKTVTGIFNTAGSAKSFLREITLLRLFCGDHPNVVSLKHIRMPASKDTFSAANLIFNFQEANLQTVLNTNQALSTRHIQFFLYQILCALQYIHSVHVIHRDLKPANILINADCSIQLCDFGLSRASHALDCLKEELQKTKYETEEEKRAPLPLSRRLSANAVTRWYRAPEVLLGSEYSSAIDMWALGCIFAELLMRHPQSTIPLSERRALFPGEKSFPLSGGEPESSQEQLHVILDQLGTPSPEDVKCINRKDAREYLRKIPMKKPKDFRKRFHFVSKEAISLLSRLLTFNPRKRLTAAEALKHPFFDARFKLWIKNSGYGKGESLTFPLSSLVTDGVLTEKGKSLLRYYEFERSGKMTKEKYRALILAEIDHYHLRPAVAEQKKVTPEGKKGQPPETTVTSACPPASSSRSSSPSPQPLSPRAASSLFKGKSPIKDPPPQQTGSISYNNSNHSGP